MTEYNTHRYIDALQDIVTSINHSYHRMIKCRPVDVTRDNENIVWETLYGTPEADNPVNFKFKVGDKVRITKEKHIFQKGYLPNFTQEVFEIVQCIPRHPPVYKLKDWNDELIKGMFYEQELVKVIKDEDDMFKLEKIIRKHTKKGVKEVLVKWMGYPNKFNQWIPESSIMTLKA